MYEVSSLEAYKKAYFEIYKEQRRKSFFSHLIIYILVRDYLYTKSDNSPTVKNKPRN